MRSGFDSPSLTAEERFDAVAVLLAVGLLRLHDNASDKTANSSPNCLELSSETVLSVHTG